MNALKADGPWILTAKSESGDSFGPWAFEGKKPTRPTIRKLLQSECEGEFPGRGEEKGPGEWGSYLWFELVQAMWRDP